MDLSAPAAPALASAAVGELRARFLAAQLRGDRREALRVIEEEGLGRGLSVTRLQLEVVQEAQREIGRLWEENRITIAQEHMATAVAQLALARLFERAPGATPNGKRVLVACVEGELHDFPARLVADALELAGFGVHYLGANVPTDSLVTLAGELRPDLVALSVTMSFNAAALRSAVARLRAATGPVLPVVVGGRACSWSSALPAELGVAGCGADALEMVAAARRLLGVPE